MGDAEMKRHEWELPVPPECLQLQVRPTSQEVPEGHQFAIRGAVLDSFPTTESSFDGSGPAATVHPRGNA
jgi:hypothetical protein